MIHLDMIGKPCPIPVVEARRALMGGAEAVAVDVDNLVAVRNLEKMALGEGYAIRSEALADNRWRAVIETAGCAVCEETPEQAPVLGGATILIGREGLGGGSDELGRILMKGFLFSLTQWRTPPRALIFLNGGAKLTTAGANTIPDLQTLADKGTEIYTCGTCANYYGITDQLAVGKITDMMAISEMLAAADRTISL